MRTDAPDPVSPLYQRSGDRRQWMAEVPRKTIIAAAELRLAVSGAQRRPEPQALALLLRPPSDGLWRYGGEIYIGYSDGSHGYRDQYGRTSRDHEIVAKLPPSEPPGLNEPCPCGSGDTYGTCCEPRSLWERAPWDVLSLRERNLRFINALINVLGLAPDVPWTQVQREFSDEQVSRVHRLSQGLWPADTDLAALLPNAMAMLSARCTWGYRTHGPLAKTSLRFPRRSTRSW